MRGRLGSEGFTFSTQKEPIPVTASIGVATTCDAMETAESLLGRADAALYAAKRGGRNRVCTADPDGGAQPAQSAAG